MTLASQHTSDSGFQAQHTESHEPFTICALLVALENVAEHSWIKERIVHVNGIVVKMTRQFAFAIRVFRPY